MTAVLAVDLGGTKTATAVVDQAGNVTNKCKQPAARTLEDTLEQIARECSGVEAAGMVIPGIWDAQRGMAWAPNLWGTDEVALGRAVKERIRVPTFIASDRTGYVLGEGWLGAAQGFDDAVFVSVGTGIGVGILSGGRVLEGAHGIAGAAGWMAVDRQWKPAYAQTGCWETEAAGRAVARRLSAPRAEDVVSAARRGDPRAVEALRATAEYLGLGIANLISVLDPSIVVLGGGLMQAADLMMDRIRHVILQWAQPVAARKVRIELTRLGEDAGLLGAARLAFISKGKGLDVSQEVLRKNA